MSTGKINVKTENIFPVIKKFLYSDQEIFLRELISNAIDASQKMKTLVSLGKANVELGDMTIDVKVDKEAKTLSVIDHGIGMTEEEVKKYINQIAFSSAEEFVEKYKGTDAANIIGHFGLGFYSAFMVSSLVEIKTKSYQDDMPAVHWTCDGSTEFKMKQIDKADRGTEIILHIADDSAEFLEENRIVGMLHKYCRFLPVPIRCGMEKKWEKPEGKDKEEEVEVPRIINNTNPIWKQQPSALTDEDYKKFYHELYPMSFEDPLFQIHLNVDYPFNLTGVLYFPKVKNQFELQKNKVQLYCNQVFITDQLDGIIPNVSMNVESEEYKKVIKPELVKKMEKDMALITEPVTLPVFTTVIKDSEDNLLFFEIPETKGGNKFNVWVYQDGGNFVCQSSFVCDDYDLVINADRMAFHNGYLYSVQDKKGAKGIPMRLVKFKLSK